MDIDECLKSIMEICPWVTDTEVDSITPFLCALRDSAYDDGFEAGRAQEQEEPTDPDLAGW